ncbi:hypothetical protein MOF11_11565 [Bacillus haynesii]|uniref:hypothetical protein n=1 Tax=Bacillus haynesii TaxID=1925021 RepID=UPI00227F2B2F|nr:hypothetical protein [Bacillus haynesii]MCY9225688.1 hypothetical protein [Bacillus haynesii]
MKNFIFLLSIFLLSFTLSACSSENTSSEEKETKNAESEDNSIQTNNSSQKAFNFSLEEFAQAYNEKAEEIENDEEMNSPILNRIIFDDIGDFEYDENKNIYTRELISESDDSGGSFTLNAWYDSDQNFNGLNLSTFGSDNMASDTGLFNTLVVFQILGIDIGHLNDLLKSDQDMLDIEDGDYSVHLAKLPDTAVIIKIEPK